MTLRVNVTTQQMLDGLQAVITGVQTRRVSKQFNNATDVKEYPYMLLATVVNDSHKQNKGKISQLS